MIHIQCQERDLFAITGLSDEGNKAFVRTMSGLDPVEDVDGPIVFTRTMDAVRAGSWGYFRHDERLTIPGIPSEGSVEQLMARAAIWERMDISALRPRHTTVYSLWGTGCEWQSGLRLAAWQLAVALKGDEPSAEDLRALAAWADVDRHEMVIERTTGIRAEFNPLAEYQLTGRISYADARLRGRDLGVKIEIPKFDAPSPWSMTTAMMLTLRLLGEKR